MIVIIFTFKFYFRVKLWFNLIYISYQDSKSKNKQNNHGNIHYGEAQQNRRPDKRTLASYRFIFGKGVTTITTEIAPIKRDTIKYR